MKAKKKLNKILRVMKAINRQLALERGTFVRGGAHATSKKDIQSRQKNSVDLRELSNI